MCGTLEEWDERSQEFPSWQSHMLKIIFEFLGGPHDGRILDGVVGEASDAERCFLFSNWGRVGQRFKVASDYAVETLAKEQLREQKRHHFQRHFYVVTERLEDDDEVWVRGEYVPQSVETGSYVSVRARANPNENQESGQ
jgi:hypothetical protein